MLCNAIKYCFIVRRRVLHNLGIHLFHRFGSECSIQNQNSRVQFVVHSHHWYDTNLPPLIGQKSGDCKTCKSRYRECKSQSMSPFGHLCCSLKLLEGPCCSLRAPFMWPAIISCIGLLVLARWSLDEIAEWVTRWCMHFACDVVPV